MPLHGYTCRCTAMGAFWMQFSYWQALTDWCYGARSSVHPGTLQSSPTLECWPAPLVTLYLLSTRHSMPLLLVSRLVAYLKEQRLKEVYALKHTWKLLVMLRVCLTHLWDTQEKPSNCPNSPSPTTQQYLPVWVGPSQQRLLATPVHMWPSHLGKWPMGCWGQWFVKQWF